MVNPHTTASWTCFSAKCAMMTIISRRCSKTARRIRWTQSESQLVNSAVSYSPATKLWALTSDRRTRLRRVGTSSVPSARSSSLSRAICGLICAFIPENVRSNVRSAIDPSRTKSICSRMRGHIPASGRSCAPLVRNSSPRSAAF
jgi:hypothetical protein